MLSCFSHVQLFATSWTVVCQAPKSMGFSRQEYWSGLPYPPPGILPDSGIKPTSLKSSALAAGFFTNNAIKFPWLMTDHSCFLTPFTHFAHSSIPCIWQWPTCSLYLWACLFFFFFWIPYISEITGYLSFSNWLISLSIMPLRSILLLQMVRFCFFYGVCVFSLSIAYLHVLVVVHITAIGQQTSFYFPQTNTEKWDCWIFWWFYF